MLGSFLSCGRMGPVGRKATERGGGGGVLTRPEANLRHVEVDANQDTLASVIDLLVGEPVRGVDAGEWRCEQRAAWEVSGDEGERAMVVAAGRLGRVPTHLPIAAGR